MKILETTRLNLREIMLDDAAFMLDLLNQPSFIQNIGDRNVRTLDDARAIITGRYLAAYQNLGFGVYLVELKENAAPIGICGLIKRDALDDVDIGYALLPQYWSQGYAVESAMATMVYAKNNLRLPRVVGIVVPDNTASIRVLEKLGLRFEKMIRLAADENELMLFG